MREIALPNPQELSVRCRSINGAKWAPGSALVTLAALEIITKEWRRIHQMIHYSNLITAVCGTIVTSVPCDSSLSLDRRRKGLSIRQVAPRLPFQVLLSPPPGL